MIRIPCLLRSGLKKPLLQYQYAIAKMLQIMISLNIFLFINVAVPWKTFKNTQVPIPEKNV